MVWGQGQKCPQSVPAVVFWKKARSRYTRLEKSWSRVRKTKRNLMKVKRPPRQPANSELGRNWGGDSRTHQGSMESPEPFRQSQRVSGVPRTHQMTPRYGQRPPKPIRRPPEVDGVLWRDVGSLPAGRGQAHEADSSGEGGEAVPLAEDIQSPPGAVGH